MAEVGKPPKFLTEDASPFTTDITPTGGVAVEKVSGLSDFQIEKKKKLDEENPSVGLVLCKSKDEEVVRIAISKAAASVKVATYKTKIIDRKLLKSKLHSLPCVGE